ncbi:MAG: alpha/beta fold hydrolase [Bdellovibrionales bacterium]|nr:alpha/beta fold hydrolase [Bdellovibrionales bacterium]
MGFVGSVFFLAGLGAAWIAFWRAYYAVNRTSREAIWAETPDGWRVALSRYRPDPGVPPRKHPVILCPGLGANSLSFDLGEDSSLARFLSSRGFDVWVLDLRGHGLADRINPFADRYADWSLDTYVTQDAPVALAAVRAATGAEGVHWVGHSMGGLILYAQLCSGVQGIRSGLALASSMDSSAHPSWFKQVAKMKWALPFAPVTPLGIVSPLWAPLAARVENPLDEFNMRFENTDHVRYRRVLANVYHGVPSPLLRQLESSLQPGGLRRADGTPYLDGAAACTVPVMALVGTHDRQAPPDAAKATLERFASAPKRDFQLLENYGHFDLLIGKRAPAEVYPRISDWLESQDA